MAAWGKKQRNTSLRMLGRFGYPYRSIFVRGCVGTLGVVLFRLALPWPLRGVVEIIFPGKGKGSALVEVLPQVADPVLLLGVVYFLIAIGIGLFEMLQRVSMKQFAAQTVHDMRASAVAGAARQAGRGNHSTGDLLARVIGDSARIKAGVSGILLHVTQNGLLFISICLMMLYLSPKLGAFFLIGGILVLFIGFSTVASVARTTNKHRSREGDYAAAIEEGLRSGDIDPGLAAVNADSVHKDVRATKLIARASFYSHVVLAAVVGFALWVAAIDVAAGHLSPGHVFLFIAYASNVHRRMVQVGRQAARGGKVLACVHRLATLIDEVDVRCGVQPKLHLNQHLRLQGIRLGSARGSRGRSRLRHIDVHITSGSRVAVMGPAGSGKSSLLRILAGIEAPTKGQILWDDMPIDEELYDNVAYMPQDPAFVPQRLWSTIGLTKPEMTPEEQSILKQMGAWPIIKRLPRGLLEKLGSADCSRGEARALALARIMIGRTAASVWLLDNPLAGLAKKAAKRRLDCILACAQKSAQKNTTVVIVMPKGGGLQHFDTVVSMRRGKIRFQGTPKQWKERKTTKTD